MQTAIFPIAGPLPVARAQLAWIACLPWFYLLCVLSRTAPRQLLRATLWSYLCGVLWYLGHCYWIFQTMHRYGNLSAPMAAIVLVLFCLYLGLYHALFGALAVLQLRRFTVRLHPLLLSFSLAATWVAVELARARVTSFPWDLLGYSQVDNAALTGLAPFAGIYSISFLIAWINAAFALALVSFASGSETSATRDQPHPRPRDNKPGLALAVASLVALVSIVAGWIHHAPRPQADQQAIAVQPNLDPSPQPNLSAVPLERQLASLTTDALRSSATPSAAVILWPEAPTPWEVHEPLLQTTLTGLARSSGAPVIADSNAVDRDPANPRRLRMYNSAGLFTAQGLQTRYDKIHLVPFGEFVPYADLFQFAGGLTEQVGTFDRGTRRIPLRAAGHTYGVFICYESIFPDEVRQLVAKGADVLVNLSDDGWYGDTSAPFQHSNMARMRAIENRRWMLRDTNTGITESIDPYGNIRATAPRHQRLAAMLPFAFTNESTFYTRHGDLFAWLCVALTAAALAVCAAGAHRGPFRDH
ncbi:apolipoprotein N-acyltransferase [Terriglobus aquaticus]